VEVTDKLNVLRGIAMLRGLTDAELAELSSSCHWRVYDAGALVLDQDSDSQDVYFIAVGRVRVTIYAENGREVAFRDLTEGASFGELSAIDGRPRSASVVALTRLNLARLPRDRFWALVRDKPIFAENLLRNVAGLVRSLTERVIDYSTLGVQNRIQAELVRMARESGVAGNCAVIAPIPRHADIASRVSTNREAVTRELSQLSAQGVVERRPDALVITDLARLADMVARVRRT
jgi:CRP-like cAMP-binding protein